jgi:uroporphyrinogen III methyltransferase/synthase
VTQVRAGKVYLLGAGPGDPDLVTLRAKKHLAEADVVLYDALVHEDLLRLCRKDAKKVFVGKRAGRASERQAAINERMVSEARAGNVVARLKGGDPYLFGRGSEEAEHLANAGVAFEVVPGVTSPLAVCAYAGISLTHRDLASSVAFITAVESGGDEETSHDWAKLATATDTLVIFMGVRTLGAVMDKLVANGRSPSTPAAVFHWASLPQQRTVVGTVATIAELADKAELALPALTVVGDVVGLREKLRWYDTQPLFGKRVFVGRAEEQNDGFAALLRARGAEPVAHPLIRIEAPEAIEPLQRAVQAASSYRWVLFTSSNAVHAFLDEAKAQGRDARVFGEAKICAIGPATAESLAAYGIRADLTPAEYRGEAVAEALRAAEPSLKDVRVLLPRAAVARDVLPDTLRANGALVDIVDAYRTAAPPETERAAIAACIENGDVDVVTITSPSSVQNLVRILGPNAAKTLERLKLASIGPVTTKAAQELGLTVHITATEYTTVGLLDALESYYTETH